MHVCAHACEQVPPGVKLGHCITKYTSALPQIPDKSKKMTYCVYLAYVQEKISGYKIHHYTQYHTVWGIFATYIVTVTLVLDRNGCQCSIVRNQTHICVNIQTKLTTLLLSIAGCSSVHIQAERDRDRQTDRHTRRDTTVVNKIDLHGYGSNRECEVFPLSVFTGNEGEQREREGELVEVPN